MKKAKKSPKKKSAPKFIDEDAHDQIRDLERRMDNVGSHIDAHHSRMDNISRILDEAVANGRAAHALQDRVAEGFRLNLIDVDNKAASETEKLRVEFERLNADYDRMYANHKTLKESHNKLCRIVEENKTLINADHDRAAYLALTKRVDGLACQVAKVEREDDPTVVDAEFDHDSQSRAFAAVAATMLQPWMINSIWERVRSNPPMIRTGFVRTDPPARESDV